MAENHMVRCSAKQGDRVTHVGGLNSDGTPWKMSEQDAIAGLKNGKLKFYVNVVDVNSTGVWLMVDQKQGRDTLSTTGDPSMLLNLPDCP